MKAASWVRGVAVLAVVGVCGATLFVARAGDDDDDDVAVDASASPVLGGLAEPLADVSEVMGGRFPELFVDLPWVLGASGTSYEAGNETTELAASSDEGRSFRAIEFPYAVASPKAVLHGSSAVVVGLNCAPPAVEGDAVCETAAADQVAFDVDLESGAVEEIEPAPIDGTATVAVGAVGGASVFLAVTADGEKLVTRTSDDRWVVSDAPAGADTVCAVDDSLVAVSPGAPLPTAPPPGASADGADGAATTVPASGIPEVGEGAVAWQAAVSDDGGRSWSEPRPFRSQIDRDFPFVLGVTCGPRYVLVNTAQVAAFDPRTVEWSAIDLPAEVAGSLAPGVAASWASADEVVAWTLPESLAPVPEGDGTDEPGARGSRSVRITGIGTERPAVEVGDPVVAGAGQSAAFLSPSAEANGFVVDVGRDVRLGRVQ